MTGILMLDSLTRGNTLKQGDKTPLTYKLLDADGDELDIAGKTATVRLVHPNYLTIGYEKTGLTVAPDDTVTFTIDKIIPARKYHVEIIVDNNFVFPSRSAESKFTIDRSSLGTESNIIEIVGKEVLINTVKAQVDTELQPLVTSMESARQAEIQRASVEASRVSAEAQRETDHANRSAELAGKADKVAIKNLIENGDFSEGTKDWNMYGYNADFEVIDGVAKTTSLSSNNRSFIQTLSEQPNIGDMTYVSVNTRVDHPDKLRDMSILSNYAAGESNTIVGPVSGITREFMRFSGTIRHTGNFNLRILYYFKEIGEYPAYLKDVVAINLTQIFGAGNEPTKEQMDNLIKATGYIDGEYALNNQEMLVHLMNDIRGKADKVVINNLVSNGDFSSPYHTDWAPNNNITYNIANNEIVVTGNGSTVSSGSNWFSFDMIKPFNDNSVYYITALAKGQGTAYIGLSYDGSGFDVDGNFRRITYLGRKMVYPLQEGRAVIGGSLGDAITFKEIMAINLTQTFGAGNEPTEKEMEDLLENIGFIDDEYDFNNKEMLNYLMKGKASKKQEDWITPTLMTGATAKEGFPVGYMKDEMGFVHFRGKLIMPSYGRLALQLPVGYRPSSTIDFLCFVYLNKLGKVSIQWAGGVYPSFPYDDNSEYDLSNITFKADN